MVGLLLLLLPSLFQSSMTAGLTEFVLLLPFRLNLLMMLLLEGAGRSSLGIRDHGRRGACLRCLPAWRLSLQLLRKDFPWLC